jgi:hypothetical protein
MRERGEVGAAEAQMQNLISSVVFLRQVCARTEGLWLDLSTRQAENLLPSQTSLKSNRSHTMSS